MADWIVRTAAETVLRGGMISTSSARADEVAAFIHQQDPDKTTWMRVVGGSVQVSLSDPCPPKPRTVECRCGRRLPVDPVEAEHKEGLA